MIVRSCTKHLGILSVVGTDEKTRGIRSCVGLVVLKCEASLWTVERNEKRRSSIQRVGKTKRNVWKRLEGRRFRFVRTPHLRISSFLFYARVRSVRSTCDPIRFQGTRMEPTFRNIAIVPSKRWNETCSPFVFSTRLSFLSTRCEASTRVYDVIVRTVSSMGSETEQKEEVLEMRIGSFPKREDEVQGFHEAGRGERFHT